MKARVATGLESYEQLTVHVFGRYVGIFVEINIIIFCFGTSVAYVIAVGDILQPFLEALGIQHVLWPTTPAGSAPAPSPSAAGLLTATDYNYGTAPSSGSDMPEWQHRALRVYAMSAFFFLIMMPLSLMEKINSLRFTSFLGVVSIFYLVLATMYSSISRAVNLGFSETWAQAELFVPDYFKIVQAAPIIMFAFTCQVNVFSIYNELERASRRRMGKVSSNAIFLCFMVYALMGAFGVLEYGKETQGNILQNFMPVNCDNAKRDPVILVAFVAIALTIVMAFPLNIFPCRYTLDVLLFGEDREPSTVRHFLLTVTICAAVLITALCASDQCCFFPHGRH